MTLLVSIDPGLRLCGLAIFTDGVLTTAVLVKAWEKLEGPEAYRTMAQAIQATVRDVPTAVAIETPQQYHGSPAPRSRVQALEGVVGAIAAVFAPYGPTVVHYLPREWKGQLPKPVAFQRVLGRLSVEELNVEPRLLDVKLAPTSQWGHVVDAVGIGLHHLGRLGTVRAGGRRA